MSNANRSLKTSLPFTEKIPYNLYRPDKSFLSINAYFLEEPRGQAGMGVSRAAGTVYLVDCGVLPQRQVPEAAANLVSALADCAQEGKRIDIRQQQGHSPRRRPGPHPPGAAYPV